MTVNKESAEDKQKDDEKDNNNGDEVSTEPALIFSGKAFT